jgi:NCAIR mutase (PurE)-related protein
VNPADVRQLLEAVAAGEVAPAAALERLSELPYADLGFAKLDLHRELRVGLPEAVYAEGKQAGDLEVIVRRLVAAHGRVLVTRLAAAPAAQLLAALDLSPARGPGEAGAGGGPSDRHGGGDVRVEGAGNGEGDQRSARDRGGDGRGAGAVPVYHERARILTCGAVPVPSGPPIAVLAAGTSDLPVAEEAAICAEWFGHPVDRAYDVGVAGLHRLLGRLPEIRRAGVVIAVAGMDGALPTVVASLVPSPIVAVPTSVGYGASFGGIAPLLTMLNGCAPGVGVVNIDNGYGAAVLASRIARLALAASLAPAGVPAPAAAPR